MALVRSGGHTGPVAVLGHWGCNTLGCGGDTGVWLAHLCQCLPAPLPWVSVSGADLKRDMGELSPPGSHPLPSLVNPHCWISATAWWFGLCQLQSAVSQNMICLWQAFKCMCLLLIMCWGFFLLFLLFL